MAYAVVHYMGYVLTHRNGEIAGFLWTSRQPDYMTYWSRSFMAEGVDGLEFA